MSTKSHSLFTVTVVVFVSCLLSLSSQYCPNPSTILPCNCTNQRNRDQFGPVDNYVVFCDELKSTDVLSKVSRNLRGHLINRLVVFNSDIGFLPNFIFKQVTVKEVFIKNTPLKYFANSNESAFSGLENSLEYLLLRKCDLNSETPFEVFSNFHKLTQLDLSSNKITRVKDSWFKNPPSNLKMLYLRQNQITTIDSFAFANIENLLLLDLAENNIKYLQRSMFPKPSAHLTFLYLSYNKITAFPSNIFTDMPSLQRLYLDFNELLVLDADSWLPVWATIKYLDLMGNNVTCDCSLFWMTELNLPPRLYGECKTPKSLEGHPLSTLWPWHIAEAPELVDQRCASITTTHDHF